MCGNWYACPKKCAVASTVWKLAMEVIFSEDGTSMSTFSKIDSSYVLDYDALYIYFVMAYFVNKLMS